MKRNLIQLVVMIVAVGLSIGSSTMKESKESKSAIRVAPKKHVSSKTKYRQRLLRKCRSGQAQYCRYLARLSKKYKRYGQTQKWYKIGCNLGDASSCYHLGRFLLSGRGGESNIELALEYFRQACGLRNYRDSCHIFRVNRKLLRQPGAGVSAREEPATTEKAKRQTAKEKRRAERRAAEKMYEETSKRASTKRKHKIKRRTVSKKQLKARLCLRGVVAVFKVYGKDLVRNSLAFAYWSLKGFKATAYLPGLTQKWCVPSFAQCMENCGVTRHRWRGWCLKRSRKCFRNAKICHHKFKQIMTKTYLKHCGKKP